MAIDEPVSRATELFVAKRVLDAHWAPGRDRPWQPSGCLECRGQHDCPQLDWALEIVADVASVLFQKECLRPTVESCSSPFDCTANG
ncbi:hypothetical protein [Micromonospora sp. NPDC005174]|uniref:hypothetical protein n=1 Tax=Micromonospora sp. NPDC005174 TaxID=3157018 RepID=UPI0033B153C2